MTIRPSAKAPGVRTSESQIVGFPPADGPHPVRLRLSRRKGFDLQAHSHAVNGLPAVNVARPTKWGNPFKVGSIDTRTGGRMDAETAIERYLSWLLRQPHATDANIDAELRGKNLACWCKAVDQHGNYVPCHADVLLLLADRMTCEEVRDENFRWAKGKTV